MGAVKFYVGVTDEAWYRNLAANPPDEVNFWRPGGTARFRAIKPGALFLFKLRRPKNCIVGGGHFVSFTLLPLSFVWQAFGAKNGRSDFLGLQAQIAKYRGDPVGPGYDPVIGNIILSRPFFFAERDWIPTPPDWQQNIVQGKSYSTDDAAGRRLWQDVLDRLEQRLPVEEQAVIAADAAPLSGPEYALRGRLGQGAFRVLVADAYTRRCAITGERTLPVLQAAHIKPVSQSGPNLISNGLLLRSDLHILFDKGLLTVTRNLRVEVSQRVRDTYNDGREYYELHGRALETFPHRKSQRPAPEFIDWHNANVFAR